VSVNHPLAGVHGVYNGIVVSGDAIGQVMFYGRGAGALPTASAVVADIIDAVKHFSAHKTISWGPGVCENIVPPSDTKTRRYLRTGEREAVITPKECDGMAWAEEQGLKPQLALRVLEP
jgi:homoserine dehydrogenase